MYSEPGSGSDLASLKTTAVRDGDHYVVNGQKVWSSQAYSADYAILLARTDTAAPKHKGISYFILDMHAPGVEVRRLKQITGGAEFCEEFLTNVKVPVENRIGEEGEGWVLAQTTLGFERGGSLLARATRHKMVLNRLIEVCQTMPRNGGVGHRRSAGAPEDRQDDGRDRGAAVRRRCACSPSSRRGSGRGQNRPSTSCTTARWTSGTRS